MSGFETNHEVNDTTPKTADDSLRLAKAVEKSPEEKLDAHVMKVLAKYEQEFRKADENNDDKGAEAVVAKAAKDLDTTLKNMPDLARKLSDGFKKQYNDVFVFYDKDGNQVPWGFKIEKNDQKKLQASYLITGPVGGGSVVLSP